MLEENSEFLKKLKEVADKVDGFLDSWLPQADQQISANLNEAVRYSAMAGGKRIRPALCVLVAEGLGYTKEAAYRAGCAYELIHCYSLIHDDLPAMDNDDLRRGKPTNHKIYGEATAILAGDSLLTMAFEWFASLIQYSVPPERVVKIIQIAADMAGHKGMIGGQVLDLTNENKSIDQATLEHIHLGKTAALLAGPILTGAVLAGVDSPSQINSLKEYSKKIGLLFQIVDDILDVEGDSNLLGKNTGRDLALGKSTYPALLGLEQAKTYAKETCFKAIEALGPLGEKLPVLKDLAYYFFNRKS